MNYRKFIGILFIIVCIASVFAGCGKQKKESKKGFQLYYLNKDETKLVTQNYDLKKGDETEQINDVLSAMNKVSSKLNCVTALPDDVSIENWSVSEQNITVSFSVEYLSMKPVREVMCRSAIVLMLTQIEGIDYVTFYVGDEPLADSNNEPVGMMKAADFVNSSGSSINNYQNVEVILYFGNATGDKLVEETYSGVYSQNISMERYVIEKLIKGPNDDNQLRTIPADTKIISVTTKDGICYVNLDSAFLDENVDVSDEVEVYSIVNSLCELTTVNKVQISINGELDKKLHNSFSLSDIFTRDLDLLENKNVK